MGDTKKSGTMNQVDLTPCMSQLQHTFQQLSEYIIRAYRAFQQWVQALPDEEAICLVLSIGRNHTTKNLLGNKRYDRLVGRVKQLEMKYEQAA